MVIYGIETRAGSPAGIRGPAVIIEIVELDVVAIGVRFSRSEFIVQAVRKVDDTVRNGRGAGRAAVVFC